MKQVNIAQIEADQELLSVAKWTLQMLEQNTIAYGESTVNPHGYDEFCAWSAAVRVAVAKAEVSEDSQKKVRRTHADVKLPW